MRGAVLLVSGIGLGAYLQIIVEAIMDVTQLVDIAAKNGVGFLAIVVLIILHVYNVKVFIPGMMKSHREDVAGIVETFRIELKAERDQCHDDHTKMDQEIMQNHALLERVFDRVGGTRGKEAH